MFFRFSSSFRAVCYTCFSEVPLERFATCFASLFRRYRFSDSVGPFEKFATGFSDSVVVYQRFATCCSDSLVPVERVSTVFSDS